MIYGFNAWHDRQRPKQQRQLNKLAMCEKQERTSRQRYVCVAGIASQSNICTYNLETGIRIHTFLL